MQWEDRGKQPKRLSSETNRGPTHQSLEMLQAFFVASQRASSNQGVYESSASVTHRISSGDRSKNWSAAQPRANRNRQRGSRELSSGWQSLTIVANVRVNPAVLFICQLTIMDASLRQCRWAELGNVPFVMITLDVRFDKCERSERAIIALSKVQIRHPHDILPIQKKLAFACGYDEFYRHILMGC